MRFINNIKSTILILSFALIGFSCSDSNSSMSPDEAATINGKVESTNAKSVNAATTTVFAGELNADGSIQTISGTETSANADGSFSLNIDAEMYNQIVIQAESNGLVMYGYMETEIENGSSYTIKPLNQESTAETMVYIELMSQGNSDAASKAEIELVVTSENAGEISLSSSVAAEVANSITMASEVRSGFFESEFSTTSDIKLETMQDAFIQAKADLEAELNTATTTEMVEEAYIEFNTKISEAYASAEVELSTAAKTSEMWSRALVSTSATLSSEVKAEMMVQVAALTAQMTDAAVQAQIEAAGATNTTVNAVVSAGAELETKLQYSVQTMAGVEAAFEAYHDSVKSALESDVNFSATVIAEIDTAINAQSGAKAVFEAAISGASSADLMVTIYDQFFTSIESSVDSSFEGSDAEIAALIEIITLINIAS